MRSPRATHDESLWALARILLGSVGMRTARHLVPASLLTAPERASPANERGRARLEGFLRAFQQSGFAEPDNETEARPEPSVGYVKPSERQPR